jgi:phenylacetate-coenzyme A ligase PaaK-like adenylate-forming protein
VFMQCEAGRFHQNVEHCHVDFQPLLPCHGGPQLGRILVSTFHNPWRSLLRFDLGDLVKVAEAPCSCGRHEGLTLESIEGRVANATLSSEGRLITQRAVDAVIAKVEGVEQYELVQTERGSISIAFVGGARASDAIKTELGSVLRQCYGDSVEVIPVPVRSVSPTFGVKYQLARATFPIDINDFLTRGA